MAFFPEVPKIKYEGPDSTEPARLPPLQRRRDGRRQVDEGAPPLRRCLLAHLPRHGRRSVRPRLRTPAVGGRHRLGRDGPQARPRRLRVHGEARRPVLLLPRPRRRPRRQEPRARPTPTSTRSSRSSKEEQQRTGIKLLWGTANLFSNPRYVHGAATSSNADVFAYAAAQVKKAWKSPRNSAASTTSSGAAAKATRTSTTPT